MDNNPENYHYDGPNFNKAIAWIDVIKEIPIFRKELFKNSFQIRYIIEDALNDFKKAIADPAIEHIVIAIDSPGNTL